MSQLRDRAPMADVLASVNRLTTLARVGRVVLDRRQLRRATGDEISEGVSMMADAFEAHGLEAIELATTMTDAEFLKLAGLLTGEPNGAESLMHSADGMSIWNVRFLSAQTGEFVRVPSAAASLAVRPLGAPPVAPVPAEATQLPPEAEALLKRLEVAVTRGDGVALCSELAAITLAPLLVRAATPKALELVVEQLLENAVPAEQIIDILQRAGPAGARAAFSQLIAAIDITERRTLYDAMAALPATTNIAHEFLNHDAWYVVRSAVCLLGESRSPSAITAIGQALRHADYRVRIAAVVSLGQIGGPVAIARLESVLFDVSIDVRTRALTIVFAAPESSALPDRVVGTLNDDMAIEFQLEMVAALGHLQTPRARQRLQQVCETPSNSYEGTELRLAALDALRRGHPTLADALLKKLEDDPSPMVRERIATLLKQPT